MLPDSWLCPICPGHLRISPASDAGKHRAWHVEQEKKDHWMFGTTYGRKDRRNKKTICSKPTGRALKNEFIPIRNVDKALNE